MWLPTLLYNRSKKHQSLHGQDPEAPIHSADIAALCVKESHYAWACSSLQGENIGSERGEHVKTHKLCENCLKPGHSQTECNSRFSCQTCAGRHNTLLHSGNTPPTNTGVVHHISTKKAKAKLLMTCRGDDNRPHRKVHASQGPA